MDNKQAEGRCSKCPDEECSRFWCDFKDHWVCERRCENRKTGGALWPECAFCRDHIFSVEKATKYAGLTVAELAMRTKIKAVELEEFKKYPGSIIPPAPRVIGLNKACVLDKTITQERDRLFKIIAKITSSCIAARADRDLQKGNELTSRTVGRPWPPALEKPKQTKPARKRAKKRKRSKPLGKQALKRSEPLRMHLEAFQKTQKEFAEEVGLSSVFISQMTRGEKPIPKAVLRHIQKASGF